jgi:IS30 family transposase
VPGHWEGDLLMGKRMHAIATLVERKTRFVMWIALPNGHAADVVADALAAKITELPEQLRRSLTWDQGKATADHAGSQSTPVCRFTCTRCRVAMNP